MTEAPLVHVVDDDESLRTALLRLLAAAGFEARGYGSATDFLRHPPADGPGCMLLDLNLPGASGLDLQRALPRHGVLLPVVFITGHASPHSRLQAMNAGAVDFLEKPAEQAPLLDALRRALALDASQRAQRDEAARLQARFASLTQRERDVFERVVAGKPDAQVATELGIGERTVSELRSGLAKKLQADSTSELEALAARLKRSSGPPGEFS